MSGGHVQVLLVIWALLVIHVEGSALKDGANEAGASSEKAVEKASKATAPWNRRRMLQTILGSGREALTVTKKKVLRKDWCQSQSLLQRVSRDQCLSVTVINRFCYGQCNSFFIPKNVNSSTINTNTKEAGSQDRRSPDSFRSCAVCRPQRTAWTTVTLKCPSLTPPIRRQRVQIVKSCRCMPLDTTA